MGVFDRYRAGEFTSGTEWCDDLPNAWVLSEELRSERAVAQLGLDGDTYYRKLRPTVELTPGEEHLLRTDEKPKSVLPLQLNFQQESADGLKLAQVRSELSSFIDGARGLEADPQSLNAGGNF
jgi:hypothetical protein